MSCFKFEETILNLKNVYISYKDYYRINYQSCDCMELILDTGEKLILAKHREFGDDGCIELAEISCYDVEIYKHKVLMHNQTFKLERIVYFENGFVDAIKFKCNDVHLFVFALEDNLVLTMSKYDLLDEITKEVYDIEASLEITDNI